MGICQLKTHYYYFFFIDNQLHIQKIVFFQLRNDSYIYKKFNLFNSNAYIQLKSIFFHKR